MSRRCGNDNDVDSMRQRQLALICNQRIALLNNLCRHHCAVSLNGFDNIDTRLNRCDAHCGCAFSVRHNCAVKVENSCLYSAFRKDDLVAGYENCALGSDCCHARCCAVYVINVEFLQFCAIASRSLG